MKRIFLIFAIFSLVLFSLFQYKKYRDIRENMIVIGTTATYQPYTFIDDENKFAGFEADLWDEIGKRAGLSVIFEQIEFERLFDSLDQKEIDTIANQITKTSEREESYDFSSTYVYYQAQIVVKDAIMDVDSVESLSGRLVGVVKDSNYEEILKDHPDIRVRRYDVYQTMVNDLVSGDLEAVIDDKLAGVDAVRNNQLKIKIVGPGIELYENAYPFLKSKRGSMLKERVNEALESMRTDGTLEEISLKWFPIDISSK